MPGDEMSYFCEELHFRQLQKLQAHRFQFACREIFGKLLNCLHALEVGLKHVT